MDQSAALQYYAHIIARALARFHSSKAPPLKIWIVVTLSSLWTAGCDQTPSPKIPVAEPIWRAQAHWALDHGIARPDEYNHLKQLQATNHPDWTRGLALESERLDSWLAPKFQTVSSLHDALSEADRVAHATRYNPIASSVDPPPAEADSLQLIYRRHYRAGEQYPIFTKQRKGSASPPEVILDVNRLAAGHPTYRLANWVESPSGELIALIEDTGGQGRSTLRFTAAGMQEPLINDEIRDVSTEVFWNGEGEVYYIAIAPKTLQPFALKSHRLGTDQTVDATLYEVSDPADVLTMFKGLASDEIWINIEGRGSTEIRRLSLGVEDRESRLCLAREPGLRYRLSTTSNRVAVSVLSNRPNKTDEFIAQPSHSWRCPIDRPKGFALTSGQSLEDFELFDAASLLLVREGQTMKPVLIEHGPNLRTVPIKLPDFWAMQPAIDIRMGRRSSSGATLPLFVSAPGLSESQLTFNSRTRQIESPESTALLGGQPIPQVMTWSALGSDDQPIPVTLVLPKSAADSRQGHPRPTPVWVTAYGSYGKNLSVAHDPLVDILLQHGIAVAYVHVRGGREAGGTWHEKGRGANKLRAIEDFVDASREIAADPLIDRTKMLGFGQSAGAAVIAAAVNKAPGLFLGIFLDRPFLDPIDTLEDERSPLAATNYFEFGDPQSAEGFHSILAWSPYDQIRSQAYPHTWLRGFQQDLRTPPTGMVKWAARVRQLATNTPQILLDLAEDGGHYGGYNATQSRRRDAAMLAFALELIETPSLKLSP